MSQNNGLSPPTRFYYELTEMFQTYAVPLYLQQVTPLFRLEVNSSPLRQCACALHKEGRTRFIPETRRLPRVLVCSSSCLLLEWQSWKAYSYNAICVSLTRSHVALTRPPRKTQSGSSLLNTIAFFFFFWGTQGQSWSCVGGAYSVFPVRPGRKTTQ